LETEFAIKDQIILSLMTTDRNPV